MDETTLKTICSNFIEHSVGYLEDEIASERSDAMDYYYTEPFGDELEDRSAVVSSDVQDVIEGIMPDMVEIFAGGDELGTCEPVGAEDVPFAEQATAGINYVWAVDNDGFGNAHDAIKDALLQKTGIFKTWWDETDVTTKHSESDLNTLALQQLQEDSEVEITGITEKAAPPEVMQAAPDGVLYDVSFTRTRTKGRVRIETVPPEEFLAEKTTKDINTDHGNTGHLFTKTQSELIEMGFDKKQLENIASHHEQNTRSERNARLQDLGTLDARSAVDRSTREIQVGELYIWVDWDDDGVSELRQIYVAGPARDILRWAKGKGPQGQSGDANQEVDDHPFSVGSPVRMSHRWLGRSMADLVMDIQRIKSTILRQWLDNMYFTNNGRIAANSRVNLDDLLFNRPSGVVQIDGEGPAGEAIFPLVTPSLQAHAQPLLEYVDGIREIRTGTLRYNAQAPANNAYTGTLGGIQSILGQAQKREMLIARVLGEGLFKSVFKKILKLLIAHQDQARMIRYRNQWVQVDPRSWNAEMDVSINVGQGHGTKEQRMMLWNMVLQVVEKIVGYQGGLNGPFIFAKNIYHAVEQLLNAMGIRNAESIISKPQEGAQMGPPPKPDPQAEKNQIEREKIAVTAADNKATDERERIKMVLDALVKAGQIKLESDGMTVDSILKGADMFVKDQRGMDGGERSAQEFTARPQTTGMQ